MAARASPPFPPPQAAEGLGGGREVGSSSKGHEPRDVKMVDASGVAAGDLGLFVVRHALQDLRQDLARLGKGRLAVRIVRAPHHVVHTDDVAQTDADRILLKAQHDVAVEEVAGPHAVLEPVKRLAVALAVGVVHRGEYIRRPGRLELDNRQCQAGMTLEDAGKRSCRTSSAPNRTPWSRSCWRRATYRDRLRGPCLAVASRCAGSMAYRVRRQQPRTARTRVGRSGGPQPDMR